VKKLLTVVFLIVLSSNMFYAQERDLLLKQEILTALNQLAYSAETTILDEEGRSKCDYNVIEGKWYPYEPAWHTGQIINGLVDAYKVTGNDDYLEAAKKAGNWWTSLSIEKDPKLEGMLYAAHGDVVGQILVFATISDGTPGLFNLYKTTGIEKYAAVPTNAGEWMLNHMYLEKEGMFYDSVNPETAEVLTEDSAFDEKEGKVALNKVARPNNEGSLFKDMYEFTGNEKYKDVFVNLCESLLEKQDGYGLWMDFGPNHKEDGSFHPRMNLWYAESLIEGYDLTKDKRYLEAAKRTLQYYVKFQTKSGAFYYKNYVNGKSTDKSSITGSAVAFIGILGIKLVDRGVGDEFKENIEDSYSWVIKNRFSQNHPDPNLRGQLVNLRSRHKKGKHWITQRDVGTAFGMRFLAAYYNYKFGK